MEQYAMRQALSAGDLHRREDLVRYPDHTGYCIDAPELMPAGSRYAHASGLIAGRQQNTSALVHRAMQA